MEAFRTRSLGEAGSFTFVAADALTMKVREDGRVLNAVVLVATGVNADGHREVLGVKVVTSEIGPAWNTFFADLVARGLHGVKLITSDAHRGLVEAIAADPPARRGSAAAPITPANLMSVTPKSSSGWVKAQLHSVYDQPEAGAVHAQFDRVVDALVGKRPAVAEHLMVPAPRYWHSPPSPANCGLRSGRIIPTNCSTAKYAGAQMLSASPRARRHHRTGRRCPGRTTRRMG